MVKKHNTGIYQIVNKINGKRYIGSAVDLKQREGIHFSSLNNNKHHSIHFQNSYNKYGKDNFKFEVLLYCNKGNLIFYEQRAINAYDFQKELYNISPTAGRPLGGKRSKETKEKMSKAQKGRIITEEARKKVSIANKGKKRSPEVRRKISEAGIGRKGTMLGKKHSKETRDKMRKSHNGKRLSKEHIELAAKGLWIPIKAFVYKTNEFVGEYKSLKECAKELNICRSKVSNVLNKKRNQTGGYYFEHVNEKDKK